MKKKIYTVIIFLCYTIFLWGQDIMSVHTITIIFPNHGEAIPLGRCWVGNADTSNWRKPKNIDQSVLRFDTDELTPEQNAERLRLLGFFYNPAVSYFDRKKGEVILNTNRSLYRKNKIKLIYRTFVKQYYDNVNAYIKDHKNNDPVDEDYFFEQFEDARHEFCKDIKK